MITEQDLQAAIAECQGIRNPTASTCLKLAAYYTLQEKMFGKKEEHDTGYSFASEPREQDEKTIDYLSDTEFSRAICGRSQHEIWPIMDELMSVVMAINPRLYNGVMAKINA